MRQSPTPKWHGPFESDEEFIIPNSWCHEGIHTVRAKTKDFYGNESDWSELVITVPRSKLFNLDLLDWFFERFPILQLVIQRLGLN